MAILPCLTVLTIFTSFFFFNDTATTEIYTVSDTLSLHDALPSSRPSMPGIITSVRTRSGGDLTARRSEEHTSELQSRDTISYAVVGLKKKKSTVRRRQASRGLPAKQPKRTDETG